LDANERQPAVRLPVGASPVQGCQPARPSWVLPYSPSTEDSRGARACAVNWRGRSAHGAYAIMYQATNTANANTITPAQYQPTNTSSLMLEDSSLLLGGLYTHSSRLRGVMREAHRAHIEALGSSAQRRCVSC